MPDVTSTDAGDALGAAGTGLSAPPAGATRRDPWTVTVFVVAAAVIAGCLAAGLAAIVPPRTEIAILPRAGSVTEVALPAVKAIFDLTAALTVGWLLAAAWLAPPQRSGIFDVGGYRAIKAASLSAAVWCASGLALIPLTLSDTLGRPIDESISADWVISGITVLDSVRAALIAAIAAALIAVIARVVLHPGWAAVLLGLALVAVIAQANTGHSVQSGDHDVAVDTMVFHLVGISLWVGGLVALLGLVRQNVAHLDVIAHRYSTIALWAFVAVAVSGFGNAWVRITYLPDLWRTEYGRLVLVKAALLITLGVLGYLHRKRTLPLIATGRGRGPMVRLAAVEVAIMAATIGVASALSRSATPPPSGAAPSDVERVLGYDIAAEPTFLRLLLDWRVDWLLGIAFVAAAVLYLVGVRRLAKRSIVWPAGRTVAWLLGCSMVVLATSSGLGRYAEAQFSIHMMAHMLLGMIAPILLVLGGPVTLALRVLPSAGRGDVPGLREAIVSALHSRFARFVTHPLFVFPLFVISFYALYFTPLFEIMIASHLGHLVMNLHFLLVGYLYYWVIIGVDPSPRQVQPMIKLAMLLGALPFHAFFGLALMNSRTAMAIDYYNGLGLPWVADLVADQRLGGSIAWGATEIPMIIVMIALLSQWARSDEREARRSDRAGDRKSDEELDAYNRMLAGLAVRDRAVSGPAGAQPGTTAHSTRDDGFDLR
ncbi:cytochrome c oxidase assembly protein [Nakamurella sp. GG22]